MRPIKIVGTGSYLPPKVLTNFDLEKLMDTSDEWITERTGIKERHIADPDTATSDLVVESTYKALENTGLELKDIDAMIVATASPDTIYPSTACWAQKKLKIPKIPVFDISAACSGFLYGLEIASSLVETGRYRNVLVCGAEIMSKIVNWSDRNTCVLFGDGAGSVIVSASEGDSGMLASYLGADGSLAELLYQPAGGTQMPASQETIDKKLHSVHMQGREIFKHAIRTMEDSAKRVLKEADLTIDDIALFIPHQANLRIVEATCERMCISMDKTYVVIHKYGNVPAASIPLTLDEANRTGRIKRGDNILFAGFGAGFTWGAMVLKW
ncbi:MAG: ketoacyl-ACP synthase III [Candidatus Stahlbacteria bacterium]|nr:ketoacyl-ACP synthase III [Candidatus Stahlbacteria bacterium]